MRTLFFFFNSLIASIIASALLTGCISDEFTDSPSDILTFSTDTLRFDTVFTDLGTPTARLKVFNRASKAVNISSIRMRNDDGTFAMNVDGVSGKEFENVEIRANDSIFVFVECMIGGSDDPKPFKVEGMMDFITNGVSQTVILEAYGQNVRRLRGVTLDADAVFTDEMPYVVFDTLRVSEGVTLTLEPGTRLLFHDKAMLQVDGRLLAVGETGNTISLRGDRLDDVLPDTGYEILAGQWKGVRFAPSSFGNRMEFVEMQSSSFGVVVDSCGVTDREKLTLVNSWLHNSQGNVLRSEHAVVNAYGCCFSDAGEAVVWLRGGEHEFVQCTMANYYLFAISPESILTLSHVSRKDSSGISNPLMTASFENCIVYGITSPLSPGNLEETDIYMRNVLLGVSGSDDDHFISCIWDENPLFETIRDEYFFDYRLKEDSPAIDAGNPAFVTPICLKDMYGVDRLEWGNPALGAYAR
ncbi:MAG: hypothetical protein K2L11_03220 [Muribaculaceae bacterium]|nr:hypothetical protein [Muribaculaceae bacterium]